MRHKNLYSSCFVLAAVLICAGSPAYAQHWKLSLKKAEQTLLRANRTHGGDITKALQQNIARAKAVNEAFSKNHQYTRAFNLSYPVKEPLGMYKTDMVNGWTLEENNLFVSQRIIYERHLRQLLKERAFLTSHLIRKPAPSPKQLAALMPTNKKYIFMGEYHYEPVTRHLQETLKAFVAMHPEKQIFVFSEFTDEWGLEQYEGHPVFEYYIGPLQAAGIKWVGFKEPVPPKLALLDKEYNEPVQTTLLGMKTRNAHWANVLKNWRKEYPDAIFIVHAGSAHTDYNEPFSLAQQFPAQETFVMHFMPFHENLQNSGYEPFHKTTNYLFYRPGLLTWQNARAARLAGFDMQNIIF